MYIYFTDSDQNLKPCYIIGKISHHQSSINDNGELLRSLQCKFNLVQIPRPLLLLLLLCKIFSVLSKVDKLVHFKIIRFEKISLY